MGRLPRLQKSRVGENPNPDPWTRLGNYLRNLVFTIQPLRDKLSLSAPTISKKYKKKIPSKP
ncbi:hypothetical protein Patl1_11507 [Pistacia atlantica]|uniref:Uncharacterized protein n=1 Tax=Pistacia atlantica TaxID=434234 RepID=A0ACC1A4R1_9ROSI|nr:hypothetical protein Patl1_11507 [Pistacia atlantica]